MTSVILFQARFYLSKSPLNNGQGHLPDRSPILPLPPPSPGEKLEWVGKGGGRVFLLPPPLLRAVCRHQLYFLHGSSPAPSWALLLGFPVLSGGPETPGLDTSFPPLIPPAPGVVGASSSSCDLGYPCLSCLPQLCRPLHNPSPSHSQPLASAPWPGFGFLNRH